MRPFPENRSIRPRARQGFVLFITGTLKINIFILFAETFLIQYIKEQTTKRKFEMKMCLIFFIFQIGLNGFTVFDLNNSKTIFLVSLHFLL